MSQNGLNQKLTSGYYIYTHIKVILTAARRQSLRLMENMYSLSIQKITQVLKKGSKKQR